MRSNFESYVKFMIWRLEGGDKVHTVPGDPGGTTKYGFAQKFHDCDVTKLEEADAIYMYLHDYWIPNGCDELPWPNDVLVFDTAVNQNASFAKKIATWDWRDIILARMQRYFEKSNPKFFRGLINRLLQIHAWICQ